MNTSDASNFYFYFLSNDGSQHFTEFANQTVANSGPPFLYPLTGDWNGDGLTDYLVQSAHYQNSSYDTPGSTFQNLGPPPYSEAPTLILTGDFDGNGCTDLLSRASGSMTLYCSPALSPVPLLDWTDGTLTLGDFNGDGTTDVLTTYSDKAGTLSLSTGTGFFVTKLLRAGS